MSVDSRLWAIFNGCVCVPLPFNLNTRLECRIRRKAVPLIGTLLLICTAEWSNRRHEEMQTKSCTLHFTQPVSMIIDHTEDTVFRWISLSLSLTHTHCVGDDHMIVRETVKCPHKWNCCTQKLKRFFTPLNYGHRWLIVVYRDTAAAAVVSRRKVIRSNWRSAFLIETLAHKCRLNDWAWDQ